MNRHLVVQLLILGICAWVIAELAANFPYPSPIIRPLLPPKERWPTDQIKGWVDSENFAPDFLKYFARDPHRTIPLGANLVAPADGVIATELHQDNVAYLVIAMSFWDVHVVRAPAEGIVSKIEEEGVWLHRDTVSKERGVEQILERGKNAPVQKIITFRTVYGDLKVRMITSYWASRLKVWVYPGETVKKGDRIGRILLGSTTVLEAPGNITFSVKPGARVLGGETIVYKGAE